MGSFVGQWKEYKILTVVLVFLVWVSTTLAAVSFVLSLCNLKFGLIMP